MPQEVEGVTSGEGAWVGAFLLFILYCAEVTEFVLCTSNVFIKTTINAETK